MIVLDASVLIAFFDSQDVHHESAETLLTDAVDDDLVINSLTLAEVLVAPARDDELDSIQAALRDLGIEELPFAADTAVRLAALHATTGLKMPDCCVLLAADDADAGIATFDDRLTRAAQRRNVRVFRPS